VYCMNKEYLNYLGQMVERRPGEMAPRARHPEKWKKVVSYHKEGGSFLDLNDFKGDIWIWSDHHFFHKHVIEYCSRPFLENDKMHDYFMNVYKRTVKRGDVCIWAGDITFGGTEVFNREIMPEFDLTYNILCQGNHDFNKKNIRPLDMDERHLILQFKIEGVEVIISHYPFDFCRAHVLNFHGHTHQHNTELDYQVNISVDAIGFKPVSLRSLVLKSKTLFSVV
jgi:calcineurin-like phosphoesterase family protein